MKRMIFALSLVFLVGLFALSMTSAPAFAHQNSSYQTQVTAQGHFQTVDWDDYYYYRPYNPYPYTYYYGPGFSINTPFFGFYFP